MTFQGMDTAEVHAAAERMRTARRLLTEAYSALQGQVLGSGADWQGPDGEHFRGTRSTSVGPQWTRALEMLEQLAETAVRNADEQDAVSEGEGRTGTDGDSGNGSGSVQMFDDDAGDIPLDVEVQRAWYAMSPEDQKAVLQEIVDQECERYGIEPVAIEYFVEGWEEGEPLTLGSWDGNTLRLNEAMLNSPDLALAAVHEVRHAAQGEFVEQTEGGFWDWLPWVEGPDDDYERIEEKHGFTQEEIEAWRENSEPGNYVDPDDDLEGYLEQPVEVDAREAEDEFASGLTLEEFQQYQRDAGVPVSEEP